MVELTRHAERRMQQRGCNPAFVQQILDHADIDVPVGSGCRLYRLAKHTAGQFKDDRIGRFGVIVQEEAGVVITVMPILSGARGSRYRRAR